MKDGSSVCYAGLVICCQRPGTASGVTFMTLEDETGFVNLVVWTRVFQAHTVLAKTAKFLGVTGKVQTQNRTAECMSLLNLSGPRGCLPSPSTSEVGIFNNRGASGCYSFR